MGKITKKPNSIRRPSWWFAQKQSRNSATGCDVINRWIIVIRILQTRAPPATRPTSLIQKNVRLRKMMDSKKNLPLYGLMIETAGIIGHIWSTWGSISFVWFNRKERRVTFSTITKGRSFFKHHFEQVKVYWSLFCCVLSRSRILLIR